MENIFSHMWVLWLALALIAAILEMTVPSFSFSFASIAAALTILISLRYDVWVQLGGFILLLFVLILFIRPKFIHRLHKTNHHMPSRAQSLHGAHGTVTEALEPSGLGRVMVAGQDWAAKSSQSLSVGSAIKVEGHDGIVLHIVRQTEEI